MVLAQADVKSTVARSAMTEAVRNRIMEGSSLKVDLQAVNVLPHIWFHAQR